MTRNTSTPRTSPPSSTSAEKQALLAAFDTVIKTQAEERETSQREAEALRRARASSRPLIGVATLVLLIVGAYLAIVHPPWVFAPRGTPESLAIKEASLRIAMANVVQHIEGYRRQNARLPVSLEEAGTRNEDVRYERRGDAVYRLVGENGPAHATYTSSEQLSDFLGASYQIVVRRPK